MLINSDNLVAQEIIRKARRAFALERWQQHTRYSRQILYEAKRKFDYQCHLYFCKRRARVPRRPFSVA